jgi:hypothetical protein
MGDYGDQEEATGLKKWTFFLDRDILMYILEVWG